MNANEYLADNQGKVFSNFIGDRGADDTEIVDFILKTPEVYKALVTAWMSQDKLRQRVIDWMEDSGEME